MRVPVFCSLILEKFGSNPHGKPLYRIVWSEDVYEMQFGVQKRKYGTGLNRWILEQWCPPERYGTPETWELTKDLETGEYPIGPFPREGDYEHCFTFDNDGQFVQVTPSLIELTARCIEAGKMHTRSQKWAAIQQAKEKREKDWKTKFSQMWDESQDSFIDPQTGVGAEYVAPGKMGARKRKPEDIKFNYDASDLPKEVRKPGMRQISNPLENHHA